MDQDETWHGGKSRPRSHSVRWGPSSPPIKRGTAFNFWPMSVVAKQLDGLRCHLVWKQASAQATLCYMGTHLRLHKKGAQQLDQFLAHVLWPNGWTDQVATWYGGRPRPRRHCVRWGPSSPPSKGHVQPSQFSAHICCGQTPGWIKMSLGREASLGPSDIALYSNPAPSSRKGAQPPILGPCLLWQNGWMDQDAT